MADEEIVEETDEETETRQPAGNRLVIMLVACVGLLLLALGLAAGYIVGQMNSPQLMAGVAGQVIDGSAEAAGDNAGDEGSVDEDEEEEELAEAIYTTLRPEFTVNFHDGKKERYLMASIDLMARDQDIIDLVDKDMPVVRYQILRVLSRQDRTLFDEGGKDRLMGEILAAVQGVIDSPAGEVEAVYLTSFVVQ